MIEGVVRGVMESFPLQLQVECGGEMRQVALGSQTRVTKAGAAADPGTIMPGDRVRISGGEEAPGGLVAATIEILA